MENDLISRSALKSHALEYVHTQPHFHWGDYQYMCISGKEIDEIIDTAPAVDAVEVVRCKDCNNNPNFLKTSGKHMVWCRKWRCEVKDTDFCSYGKRRVDHGK